MKEDYDKLHGNKENGVRDIRKCRKSSYADIFKISMVITVDNSDHNEEKKSNEKEKVDILFVNIAAKKDFGIFRHYELAENNEVRIRTLGKQRWKTFECTNSPYQVLHSKF